MIETKIEKQLLYITKKEFIASGTQNYLHATFIFDDTWDNFNKTAVFYQNEGQMYHVVLENDTCIVPAEVLTNSGSFYIGVFGINEDERITTNFKFITINKGSYGEGIIPNPPTEDVYAQIIGIMEQQSIDAQTTFQYQETTKGYMDLAENYKNSAKDYKDETLGLKSNVEDIRDTFETNAIEKTNNFNNNAINKTNEFNNNAISKTNLFNSNYDEKIGDLNTLKDTTEGYKDLAYDYKEEAKASETNAGNEADRALNNILNGVSTHNQDNNSHPSLIEDIRTVEAIARGKATGYVFDNYQDMLDWLDIPENVEKLVIGDNLYIRDIGVKDYWWDGTTYQELEAEAPDLTDYYTKVQVDAMMPITIEQADYEDLVASGQVESGRIYFVTEGDAS